MKSSTPAGYLPVSIHMDRLTGAGRQAGWRDGGMKETGGSYQVR